MSASYCGIDCAVCTWRESSGCAACKENRGKMFWGNCRVAACCSGRGLEDCGQCAEYPCGLLREFAFDREHGDGGERLANLCRERGLEALRCNLCCGDKCARANG
jgi:hypothetical protein